MKLLLKKIYKHSKAKLFISKFVLPLFRLLGFNKNLLPSVGYIRWGDFKLDVPFSKNFGFDRGGAIDRYYIENFLSQESALIKGSVLEIGDNEYTLRYGKQHVVKSDILHIDSSNHKATIIGDLSHAPEIDNDMFDCIILTQTLHLVYDYQSVIRTCYRILKPGGVLLLTVPGISPIDYGSWGDSWLWSFNERVMTKILSEEFEMTQLDLNTYGNVRVAAAFLYGAGLTEISKKALDYRDSHFPVIVTARAVKA